MAIGQIELARMIEQVALEMDHRIDRFEADACFRPSPFTEHARSSSREDRGALECGSEAVCADAGSEANS